EALTKLGITALVVGKLMPKDNLEFILSKETAEGKGNIHRAVGKLTVQANNIRLGHIEVWFKAYDDSVRRVRSHSLCETVHKPPESWVMSATEALTEDGGCCFGQRAIRRPD